MSGTMTLLHCIHCDRKYQYTHIFTTRGAYTYYVCVCIIKNENIVSHRIPVPIMWSAKSIWERLVRPCLPFLLVFLTHYACTHLYLHICAPPFTISGLLQSFLATGSPVCTVLLSIMHTSSHLYTLAMVGGAALCIASLRKCTGF